MEYITVKEYTEITGISLNDFYKMYFNGDFDGYTKTENGNTYILKSILDETSPEKKEIQKEKEKENIPETETNNNINPDNTAELKAEIERLRNEIAEKDKKIIEFAERFAELSQQALQITSQGQYIQVLQAPDITPQAPDIPIIETGHTAETPKIKKDNILKRIFKRKQKNTEP